MKAVAYIFPLLLIASTLACEKPVETTGWNAYANPEISKVSIYDTLPKKSTGTLHLKEIKGVKVTYASGKHTSYFEYETNKINLIKAISALPFKKGNAVNDTLCRKIDIPFSLSGSKVLSKDEIIATAFFWKIEPADYDYYECMKYPERHTLLISKTTGKVLHRIES